MFPHSAPGQVIAGLSAVIAATISFVGCYRHLQNYSKPDLQLYIVRILIIVPVYALGSFLSLVFHDQRLYFDAVRDVYEAFVIYCFLALILNACGGDSNCVARIAANPGCVAHPVPLCLLPKIHLGPRFLRLCKQGTLQFVVVKPVFAVLSLIALGAGKYDDPGYQWVLFVVYNVSYTLALYVLWLFYVATRNLLRGFNPVSKFFAVKIVVFATYWQSLLINVMPGVSREDASAWNAFILCLEMLFFAGLHRRSFSYREFVAGIPDSSVLHGFSQVVSVRDVVQDTLHNFKPAYQDYVLQKPYEEAPTRTFRTRTYLIGNIGPESTAAHGALLLERKRTSSEADQAVMAPAIEADTPSEEVTEDDSAVDEYPGHVALSVRLNS